MTFPDLLALALVVIFAGIGLWQGAVRKIIGFLCFVVALALAGRYGGALGAEHWPFVADAPDPGSVGRVVGSALVFFGVSLVGVIIGVMLRKLVQAVDLGTYDRLFGLLLGGAQGFLLGAAAAIVFLATDVGGLAQPTRDSQIYDATRATVEHAQGWIPADLHGWLSEVLEPV